MMSGRLSLGVAAGDDELIETTADIVLNRTRTHVDNLKTKKSLLSSRQPKLMEILNAENDFSMMHPTNCLHVEPRKAEIQNEH